MFYAVCVIFYFLAVEIHLSFGSPAFCFHTSSTAHNPKRDYYEVLGIPKSSSLKDIKKAYYQVCVPVWSLMLSADSVCF